MKQAIAHYKDVVIKGEVEIKGVVEVVEITKFDTKNNVVAFNMLFMGKKFYVGAGKDTPKLSDIKNITFEFKDQA